MCSPTDSTWDDAARDVGSVVLRYGLLFLGAIRVEEILLRIICLRLLLYEPLPLAHSHRSRPILDALNTVLRTSVTLTALVSLMFRCANGANLIFPTRTLLSRVRQKGSSLLLVAL